MIRCLQAEWVTPVATPNYTNLVPNLLVRSNYVRIEELNSIHFKVVHIVSLQSLVLLSPLRPNVLSLSNT
jgi:hypothetical protein